MTGVVPHHRAPREENCGQFRGKMHIFKCVHVSKTSRTFEQIRPVAGGVGMSRGAGRLNGDG
jgi:hypothetical protein